MMGGEGSGKDGAQGAEAMKKGPWTAAEDAILMEYVKKHGEGNWNAVQRNSGLSRCGKSCRLRWANHLRPNLKKGAFTPHEERLILELHAKFGNKWARMATQLPGRTDNEIKNYWNTRIKRRQRAGLPLYPPDIRHQSSFHQQPHRRQQSHQGLQIDNNVAQFAAAPAPLPLFDPNHIGSSSSTMAAAIPSSLMGYSFVGDSQRLLGHISDRTQALLKRPREESWGMSTMFFGVQATPSDRLGSSNDVTSLHQHHSPSSIEMELPSNQFAPAPAGDGEDPWARNNSGLLDALLEGAQTKRPSSAAATTSLRIGGCDPSTAQEEANRKGATEGVKLSNNKAKGGNSGLSTEGKMKNKQPVNVASENEDLSALLDFMPSSQAAASRFKTDGREMSNGQSSGVTDDEDIGFDMQQLASSLNAAADDHTWNVGSDHWDNMPGIC